MAKRIKQPKTKEPQTYQEWLESEYQSWGTRRAGDHIPKDPTYRYSVGEKVIYGNLKDARVEEIFDGGVRFHISYHDKGATYGTPYDAGRKPRICWWTDLAPISTIEDTHFAKPRIHAQYSQTDLRCLISTSYWRGLIDNPDYQRGYVWGLEDKQRLVRSIFNRTDIGKFLFVDYPYPENRLEVVDGKQRLRAIMDFMEGRFSYEGKVWNQLSFDDKHSFTDIMVQTCTLDSTQVTKADILWLFLSLNTGGVPQTDEHVAKARKLYEEASQLKLKE